MGYPMSWMAHGMEHPSSMMAHGMSHHAAGMKACSIRSSCGAATDATWESRSSCTAATAQATGQRDTAGYSSYAMNCNLLCRLHYLMLSG